VVAGREVEEALLRHPSVSEVAVIDLPDPNWIEAATAIEVLKPGFVPDEAGLAAHAREHLAPFKVPKKIICADNLPLQRSRETSKARVAHAIRQRVIGDLTDRVRKRRKRLLIDIQHTNRHAFTRHPPLRGPPGFSDFHSG
jgi:acyl-coenzyme A synthetase/AMP-(fatty) acid ligase